MQDLFRYSALLLVLLNPFLLIIYLIDVVEKFELKKFARILLHAAFIAMIVFWFFVILGDTFFSNILQAEFASFQIFGGIIFLAIGLHFVFRGPTTITMLRGESENLAGAIAVPILVGPGTISASVLIGNRYNPLPACALVSAAVLISALIMIGLKMLHDYVRPKREPLIQRYIEIAGRMMALFIGTVSVEMIMQGIKSWADKF
ncbi:MAG: MarC family protein [Verrucomicrobiota bacterium]